MSKDYYGEGGRGLDCLCDDCRQRIPEREHDNNSGLCNGCRIHHFVLDVARTVYDGCACAEDCGGGHEHDDEGAADVPNDDTHGALFELVEAAAVLVNEVYGEDV